MAGWMQAGAAHVGCAHPLLSTHPLPGSDLHLQAQPGQWDSMAQGSVPFSEGPDGIEGLSPLPSLPGTLPLPQLTNLACQDPLSSCHSRGPSPMHHHHLFTCCLPLRTGWQFEPHLRSCAQQGPGGCGLSHSPPPPTPASVPEERWCSLQQASLILETHSLNQAISCLCTAIPKGSREQKGATCSNPTPSLHSCVTLDTILTSLGFTSVKVSS